ncbi:TRANSCRIPTION FACTOR BHLH47 [Salix purpurea]|uniref:TRANSCRIPTION FACTOR BHLH47 n=1 Tax=Salix purpurea TaxID=77065 RepID=A0A9Q0QGE6_SALPP|nr:TRANSCRIPTION FACTOR BHLH47 [Salix purpurea]KAJ6706171.1 TRANSCRIPTION FACTOR BHLH47 [Salix purpurea]
MSSELNETVEDVTEIRCFPAGENKGKAPKRIHKAEREKLKREQLNELFLELASALELSQPNNGKAFMLCETTRLLKDLHTQIESLKKENVALSSESHYVTVEKNELREEKSALEHQIGKLHGELQMRAASQSKPDLNAPPPEFLQPPHLPADSFRLPSVDAVLQPPHLPADSFRLPSVDAVALQQTPTVFVVPISPDHVQGFPMATSNVSKPHPRYPTAADSWPSQLLREKQIARKEV